MKPHRQMKRMRNSSPPFPVCSNKGSDVNFNRNACFLLLFLSISLFHPSVFNAGVLVCKTVPFVQTTAIVTGILTMTCIAIERYQGIVFPLKMRRQYSSKRAHKMLGIIYLHKCLIMLLGVDVFVRSKKPFFCGYTSHILCFV